MSRKPFHNLLLGLALLTLPAAARAVPSTATFSGPPDAFFGGDISQGQAYIRLNLAKEGKFTGILNFTGGTHNVIKGTLQASGSFSGTTSVNNIPYTLQVTGSTPGTYSLSGSAAGSTFIAFPQIDVKGGTLPPPAKFNNLMEATGTGNIPGGFGYNTLHVGKMGTGMLSGKLPDGTTFTAAGKLVADGTNIYILFLDDRSLYNRKGEVSGYLAFDGTQSEGEFVWIKPATKGPYYPAGFTTRLGTGGYVYSRSVGDTFTSGTLAFNGGMLGTSGTEFTFTVSSKGVATVTPPNPSDFKLSINAATGAVKGAFNFPQMISGKTVVVKYSGILLQDGTTPFISGYFLSPIISGSGTSGSFESTDFP